MSTNMNLLFLLSPLVWSLLSWMEAYGVFANSVGQAKTPADQLRAPLHITTMRTAQTASTAARPAFTSRAGASTSISPAPAQLIRLLLPPASCRVRGEAEGTRGIVHGTPSGWSCFLPGDANTVMCIIIQSHPAQNYSGLAREGRRERGSPRGRLTHSVRPGSPTLPPGLTSTK